MQLASVLRTFSTILLNHSRRHTELSERVQRLEGALDSLRGLYAYNSQFKTEGEALFAYNLIETLINPDWTPVTRLPARFTRYRPRADQYVVSQKVAGLKEQLHGNH
jgi:hypothetical protein